MAERRTPPEASASLSPADNVTSAESGKKATTAASMGTEAESGRPAAESMRDDGLSQSAAGRNVSYYTVSGKTRASPGSPAELPNFANSTLEKEVYEYIPDATLSPAPQEAQPSSSRLPAVSSIASRPARAKGCDVDEQSLPPGAAFETFKGKTYETTRFRDGFPYSKMGRGKDTDVCHPSDAAGGVSWPISASLFELGSTGFETPLGRLQRLRMEVEEMLTFISSCTNREGVKGEVAAHESPADQVATSKGDAEKDVTAEGAPYALKKEALFLGGDPEYLFSELGRLRLQILSVMNDPSLQQLFAGVEPTTGKQSGADMLLKHLQEVQASLEALPRATSVRALDASQRAVSTSEQAGAHSAPSPEHGNADDASGILRAGSPTGSSTGGSACVQTTGLTQYDIYCVPSFTPLLECSRTAALESRLAQVERRIGMSKISLLPFPDLQQGIMHISQKLALLDANKVEQLHKRTQRLLHELHALQHRRRELDISGAAAQLLDTGKNAHTRGVAVEGAGYEGNHREAAADRAAAADDQRVEELFDICERWKVKAAALPNVVERLKALKALHREAGGISVRLRVLEEQQARLQLTIGAAEQNLEVLQKTVAETVAWAKSTVQTMQQRLRRLGPSSKDDADGSQV